MRKVIIASESPVKIEAVKKSFSEVFKDEVFDFFGVSIPSGVSDQPKTNSETFEGAKNRAENAEKMVPGADFWIGIEGGIEKYKNETEAFAWVYIVSADKIGKARTASFFLPKRITELIDKGYELGDADDIVFKMKDSKKKTGAVGILTKNITSRTEYYKEAVILALIPFINKDLY